MSLIGVTIGTTRCKVIVFRADGTILGWSAREYSVMSPQPGWAEQEAERVWQMTWESLEDALAMAGRGDPPKAMALSVQGEAVIPLDRSGYTLRYALLGMDRRASAERKWLSEQFGEEALFARTGSPIGANTVLPKFLWLKKNEPDVWRNIGQFASYEDFFLRRFCGAASISHCLASRTQMYDLARGDWADDILEKCGIEREKLAPLAPAGGGVIGGLRVQLAHELGIHHEMPVVSGGYEQACAALGCGAIQPGMAAVSTGAEEIITGIVESPALTDALHGCAVSVYRHVVPGLYLAASVNPTACLQIPEPSGEERNIRNRAIPESLAFALRKRLDGMKENGIPIHELYAVDCGAQNSSWLQSIADIANAPVQVPDAPDAACRGAALLAGTGVGVYANLGNAVNQTVKYATRIEPNPVTVSAFERKYQAR